MMDAALSSAELLAPTVSSLLTPNNDERRRAEEGFQLTKEQYPDRVILGLLCICGDWCIPTTSAEEREAAQLRRQRGESLCGASPAVRSLCAVLLRRHLVGSWARLSGECQVWVQRALVYSFGTEPPRDQPELAAKLGDCAAELATEITAQADEFGGVLGAWPDLVPALLESLTSSQSSTPSRRAACDATFRLANELDDPSNMMRRAFGEALRDLVRETTAAAPDDEERLELLRRAVRALGAVIRFAPETAYDDPNGPADEVGGWLTVHVFSAGALEAPLHLAQRGGGEDDGEDVEQLLREGLEALIDVAEWRPKALRAEAPALCGRCLLDLAASTSGDVRAMAIEFVVTLAEAAPPMMRKCRISGVAFPVTAVDACFELLMRRDDLEDVDAYASALVEEKDADEKSYVELGADALDRFARALRPKAVLPRAAERLRALLSSATEDPTNRWPEACAAFGALTQLAEAYNELDQQESGRSTVPYLAVTPPKKKKGGASLRRRDLVETMLPFALRYPVARVRKEALDALAQTAADHSPMFQLETSETVVPAICEAIRRDGSARCRAAACRALFAFLNSSSSSTVTKHLQALADALKPAICDASSPSFVRELAVAALASLAAALVPSSASSAASVVNGDDEAQRSENCATLYRVFSPGLKPIAASHQTQPALRARALECLALLGTAAGRDVFGADALEIVRVVTTDYFDPSRRRPEDDGERATALKSVVMVADCLQADFAPFLQTIVPALLEAADKDDFSAAADCFEGEDEETFVVRTEALEEQASAVRLMARLAESLGSRFADYVHQCLVILAPLTTNSLHDDVRQYAAVAVPGLVACVAMKEHDNAQLRGDLASPDDWNTSYEPTETRKAAIFAVDTLLEAIALEEESDPRLAMLQALRATIEDSSRIVNVYVDNAAGMVPVVGDGTATNKKKNSRRVETPRECVPILSGTPSFFAVFAKLNEALQRGMQRRAMRLASATVDVDYDDEQANLESSREADDEELWYNVAEVLGSLLRTHGVAALDVFFNTGWPDRLRDMAHENCLESDRKFAAYVVADVFEFGTVSPRGDFFLDGAGTNLEVKRERAVAQARTRCTETFLEILVGLASGEMAATSAPRRQAAVYGIGVAADSCKTLVPPCAHQLVQVLVSVMNQQGQRQQPQQQSFDLEDDEDDFVDDDDDDDLHVALVRDNAAASLERLLRSHGVTDETAWRSWLDYLPMLGDADEADKSVMSLCRSIVSGTLPPAVGMSPVLSALGRIATAMTDGGQFGTTAKWAPSSRSVKDRLARRRKSSEPVGVLVASALNALRAANAPEFQAACSSFLDAEQQRALEKLTTSPPPSM